MLRFSCCGSHHINLCRFLNQNISLNKNRQATMFFGLTSNAVYRTIGDMHSGNNHPQSSETLFEIGADGVDSEAIMARIRETVAEKRVSGAYNDARIAMAERYNLENLRGDDTFLERYLECMRDAVLVDINDYVINERRRWFARPLVVFKRGLWKILKFYTYRLWSQQNQINGLLLAAVEETDRLYRDRIKKLEARVAELEKSEID